jgi:hypothetical protein
MKRRVLLALLCLVALACNKGAPSVASAPPPPKPPEDPWSWLPELSTTVGRVQLDALRKTPLWPLWSEVEREQGIVSWVDLNKVERITFGGTGETRENTSYVASLEGKFARDELAQLATRDGVAAEPRGLLTLYRRPEGVWAQVSDTLIVTCTPDRVEGLIVRASAGPGTAVKGAALYRSLAERTRLEQTHLGVIAEDPEGKRKAALERRASRVGLGSIAREAMRMGVGVEVGASYHLVAVAEAADGARAQALEADVREKLDALAGNFLVRLLGVGKLVGSLRPSSDGNYVVVRGDIPEEELQQTLSRLHDAMNLAGAAGLSVGGP